MSDAINPRRLGAVRLVLDPELPQGWCRFVDNDGLEHGGPLSEISKAAAAKEVTIAADLWEALRRSVQTPPIVNS